MNRTAETTNDLAANSRSRPTWLKVRLPGGESYLRIKEVSRRRKLHTVCEEARCPNVAECWGGGTATFMVLGKACTRGCRFCAVASSPRPGPLDPAEPGRLAETLAEMGEMGLEYAVVTTVCRDDLPDQGASHLAECLRAVKARSPGLLLEVLIQDFRGRLEPLRTVLSAGPDVVAHNLETVERLTPLARDSKAGYRQSLEVLENCRRLRPRSPTKSSLMLGLGETEEELRQAFRHLREAGVEILTLGQYLRPTAAKRHLPVAEFVPPGRFEAYAQAARGMGFLYVAAGPLVRSSYRAGELFLKGFLEKKHAPLHRG